MRWSLVKMYTKQNTDTNAIEIGNIFSGTLGLAKNNKALKQRKAKLGNYL